MNDRKNRKSRELFYFKGDQRKKRLREIKKRDWRDQKRKEKCQLNAVHVPWMDFGS